MADNLRRDLALAVRSLGRAPAFAITVILTIAIGMGAVAAVFGVIDAAYLRKIPVPEVERLVAVDSRDARSARPGQRHGSFPDWRDLRANVRGLDDLAAFSMNFVTLGGEHSGRRVYAAFVSGNYFEVMGVKPARGRFILRDEEQPEGAHPVAVISDVLWRETFGADEAIAGRRIVIGKAEFTVVGVAPAGFTGVQPEGRTDIWIPYTMAERAGRDATFSEREARVALFVGRLAGNASLAEVQGSLDNVARELAATHPATNEHIVFRAGRQTRMVSVAQAPDAFATMLLALAMVGLVHLVACGNIAALLMARGAARRRELGVRVCLGASRARIVSHTLAEPLLLGLAGAVGAVFIARGLTRAIGSMWFLSALEPTLDPRMVAIVIGIAILTVLQCGMMPALLAARTDPIEVVQGPRRSAGRSPSGLLIVGQVAISFVLLAQASLLVSRFHRDSSAHPGFDASRMVVAHVQHESFRTPDYPGWRQTYDEVVRRAEAVPGITRVVSANAAPLQNRWFERVTPAVVTDGRAERQVLVQAVSAGYMSGIGGRVIAGREFGVEERAAPGNKPGFEVAVVNESLARLYWPDRDPVGEMVTLRRKPVRVVGVVADMRDGFVSRATPAIYVPLVQWRLNEFAIVATADGDAVAAATRLRDALAGLPGVQPTSVRTMASIRDDALQLSRVLGIALSACAAIGLLLTAMGIYGTVAMWAATRRREIGIRIAIGARSRHVYRLLFAHGGVQLGIGAALGAFASFALVKLERSWWGQTLSLDPAVVALMLGVFALVIGVALAIPGRRATRVQPLEVMRAE